MNAYTKLSDKGQVVVPIATRKRLGWLPGIDLEVIEDGESVTLRRRASAKSLSADQAVERFMRLYRHEGPPATIEQMDRAVATEVERRTLARD